MPFKHAHKDRSSMAVQPFQHAAWSFTVTGALMPRSYICPKQSSSGLRPAERKPKGFVELPEEIIVENMCLLDVRSILALKTVSAFFCHGLQTLF
jgi:hypothetical protein